MQDEIRCHSLNGWLEIVVKHINVQKKKDMVKKGIYSVLETQVNSTRRNKANCEYIHTLYLLFAQIVRLGMFEG